MPLTAVRTFIRTSKNRLPIRSLYGPNLARELVKDSSADAWQGGVANIVARGTRDRSHASAGTPGRFETNDLIVVDRSGANACGAIVGIVA